jgi:hypothetical protein
VPAQTATSIKRKQQQQRQRERKQQQEGQVELLTEATLPGRPPRAIQ